MYHYVRSDASGIKGRTIDDFISQIDYLSNNYPIVKLDDFISGNAPDKSCVLTFDDGLKDHYLNVFPILKEKNISATFFPLTQTSILSTHKVHFLLAKLGPRKMTEEFNNALPSDEFFVKDDFQKQTKCKWDDVLSSNLKYNISIMPKDLREKIIGKMFDKYFPNGLDLYMTFNQMREMFKSGMSFGCHTHTHQNLTTLSKEEQDEEIKKSKNILEKELNAEINCFSYPYGGYNNETIELLRKNGFKCGLTTDFGVNKENVDMFALKRLDTNHIPIKSGLKPAYEVPSL